MKCLTRGGVVGVIGAAALAATAWLAVAATPVGTAFKYQGSLSAGSASFTGAADLRFRLYDAPDGGNQIGGQVERLATNVASGLFGVDIDFGSGVGSADSRWLEIDARVPAGSGSFVTLSPRQRLAPTPIAIRASDAPGIPHGFVEFSSVGDTVFVVPPDVTRIMVEVWGAGGGGAVGANDQRLPAPGGAGAYCRTVLTVVPGQAYVVTVGAAGSAGAPSGGDGQAGGSTEVRLQGSAAALVRAGGGAGGALWLPTSGSEETHLTPGGVPSPGAMVGRPGKPGVAIGSSFSIRQTVGVPTSGSVEPLGTQGGMAAADIFGNGVVSAGAGYVLITY